MADVWSPLTTHWAVNLQDSGPRTGPIVGTGHHHTATTSELGALQSFAPGGRSVTPNYFIARRRVYGIVPENRRAWTSGSAQDDGQSITYEMLNETGDPRWGIHPETLDTVKRLDADIMQRYGVKAVHGMPGFWEHRNLYVWFGRSYPTACAGPSFPMQEVISGAAAYAEIPKEDKVLAYHYEDAHARRVGRDLLPGRGLYLHISQNLEHLASNVVGAPGQYSITPHVYAEGEPGDSVDLILMWQNVAANPVVTSPHYRERLVIGPDGILMATREFKRYVAEGFAVYVRLETPASNKAVMKIRLLDSDAFAFAEA